MSLVSTYIAPTVGAAFIGATVAAMLFGVTTVQTILYFKRYSNDPVLTRRLIFVLWLLDATHLIFIVHGIYTYTIMGDTDVSILFEPAWSFTSHVLISSLSDLTIVLYPDLEIKPKEVVDDDIHLFGVFGVIRYCSFSIWGLCVGNYFFMPGQLSIFLYTCFISGVLADALIATLLCTFLSRRRTGFSRTDSLVRTLMIYSINTGVLTSICALLCLLLYALQQGVNRFSFVAAYLILPKLLLNALLASLNARRTTPEKTNVEIMRVMKNRNLDTAPTAVDELYEEDESRNASTTYVGAPVASRSSDIAVDYVVPSVMELFNDQVALSSAYLGVVASSILYGFNNMQTFIYYRQTNDKLIMKSVIFVLWRVTSFIVIVIVYALTDILLNNPLLLVEPIWSLTAHFLITSIVGTTVRGAGYSRFEYGLPKELVHGGNYPLRLLWWFGYVYVHLSALRLTLEFLRSLLNLGTPDYFFKPAEFSYYLYFGLGSSAFADVLITAFLCVLLSRHRTGIASTNSVINLLMLYSINTGLLTSLCALLALLLFACLPSINLNKFGFIAPFFVLPKREQISSSLEPAIEPLSLVLFSSLLANLNARPYLRERAHPDTVSLTTTTTTRKPRILRLYRDDSISQPSSSRQVFDTPVPSPTEMEIFSMHQFVGKEMNRWKPLPRVHQTESST
ncbi:uncharacterized protein FIBRA_04800 [Fibroporia radiculosa]|uniref:DUF6534 domain-containing protein n=1 Tax=Fibroporia radiculosa TaxID=599839 RepID=J4H357_9APHY|nr:uncharacterized protein FIBRA_04800 [Fibroporia radiculosa]CCM02694.1 predicted protein [Fibroporia radiculosa]